MMANRRTGYLAAWIAGFALLLASLLPQVFHSSMPRKAAVVSIPTEICTTSAAKPVVMVDVPKSGWSQDKPDAHAEDCPACRFQTDPPALLPMTDPAAHQPLDTFLLPELFSPPPRPLPAWASAQPRAPPTRF